MFFLFNVMSVFFNKIYFYLYNIVDILFFVNKLNVLFYIDFLENKIFFGEQIIYVVDKKNFKFILKVFDVWF